MLNKALRLLVLFSITVVSVHSQDLTKSPYSALGIGDLQFGGNALQSALGQSSQGFRRSGDINCLNPASYGSLKYTTFEAGYKYSLGTIGDNTSSSSIDNYSFGYLNVGIPISQKHRWAIAFGLQPYSSVGYNVSSNVDISKGAGSYGYLSNQNIYANEKTVGRGGISKCYFGTGIAIFRDLSIGINASYLWGQLQNVKSIYIDQSYNLYNLEETNNTYVGGFSFDYGVQYHKILKDKNNNPKYKIVLGTTLNMATSINSSKDYNARTMGVGGILNTKDTILNQGNSSGILNLPFAIKSGFSFEETDHWMICGDMNIANWSQYQLFGATDLSLKDNIGFSLGALYTPVKFDVQSNYFNHIEYRIGARYDNGYLTISGTPITTTGVSAGLGLPVGKYKSKVNVTAEYFVRGTTNNSLIQESYFRIILGITFTDKWFDRYKYY
jgi:hypothetical protein